MGFYGYFYSTYRPRRTTDSMRVSEALDLGSIPNAATINPFCAQWKGFLLFISFHSGSALVGNTASGGRTGHFRSLVGAAGGRWGFRRFCHCRARPSLPRQARPGWRARGSPVGPRFRDPARRVGPSGWSGQNNLPGLSGSRFSLTLVPELWPDVGCANHQLIFLFSSRKICPKSFRPRLSSPRCWPR